MQVELEVRRDGESPRRVSLGPGVTHLGRAPDNDVVLPDVGVSRRHARLVVRPGGAVLEDLGSGNGTFVRGERVGRHTVCDGDQVVIDPFVLILRLQQGGGVSSAIQEEDETALVDQSQLAAVAQAQSVRRARLVVLSGHGLAGSYPLSHQGLSMGRSDDRDIVMQDPAASRMQAEVRPTEDVYWLRDFGSANGTFVNGRRVRERPLQHGDRIRVGSTEFRFELQDLGDGRGMPQAPAAPAPAAPAPAAARPPVVTPPPAQTPVVATPAPAPATSPTLAPQPAPAVASVSPAVQSPAVQSPAVQSPAVPAPPPASSSAGSARSRSSGGLVGVLIGITVAALILVVGVGAMGLAVWWQVAGPGAETVRAPELVEAETPAPVEGGVAVAEPVADLEATEPVADLEATEAVASEVDPQPPAEPAAAEPAAAEPAAAEPAAAEDDLMARGMMLFKDGSYLEATALFYQALKQDPTNLEAERMCYVSCEFLAIQQLREDVRQRQVTPEQREALYTEAVRVGRRAARGRGDLDAAEQAIIAALEWYPEDGTLVELQGGIQARRARGSGGSTQRSASTAPSAPSASDRRLARQYMDEGLQAIDDGRFVVARDRLTRAVSLDPALSSARTNLDDVTRVLEDRARTAWSQGQALEAAGNSSGAISAYEQVVTYASGRQSSMKTQAQRRLDALR